MDQKIETQKQQLSLEVHEQMMKLIKQGKITEAKALKELMQ